MPLTLISPRSGRGEENHLDCPPRGGSAGKKSQQNLQPDFLFVSSSTVTKKFRYMRCQDFSPLPRREVLPHGHRADSSAVCKERATLAAAKKMATRRAAPDLTGRFVAPQSQSAGGHAPSSRLATGQIWRGACIENCLSQYRRVTQIWQSIQRRLLCDNGTSHAKGLRGDDAGTRPDFMP